MAKSGSFMEGVEGSRSSRRVLAACCLIVGCIAASGEAADTSGELHGVVVDAEGVGLPGARVSLSSEVLIGGVHEQITGDDGEFGFRVLPPGSYLVLAELGGFVPVETQTVVSLNRRTDLSIELSPSRFEDEITVEVVAEPVQMDFTRIHVGETFNQEFLEVAAIGIDGRSVLGIIGKEAGVEGGARPRIMGSTYSENVFLVDGLNTTDPVLGTAYLEINFDALQEIAVHTGGFEAEYGQALGGVINAVTKSGGNRVTGSVDLRYRDPNLAEGGEYFDPDRDPTSQFVGSATIGGPILKDRLWYFASLLGSNIQTTRYLAVLTEERRLADGLAKLTWQAAPNHRVSAKGMLSDLSVSNDGANQFIASDAGQRFVSRLGIVQTNLNSVLTDSLLLDVQLGLTTARVEYEPMHGDHETPAVLNWTDGMLSQSSRFVSWNDIGTLQIRTALTALLSGASGDHELKGGLEFRDMNADVASRQTGDVFLTVMTYNDDPTSIGYGHFDEDGDGFTDALAWFSEPEMGEPVHSDGISWSLFLQDEWRPTPSLTIKPGLRWDRVEYVNDQVRDIATLDSFQPRLGLAWDVTGRGRHVLRANIGRFMHPAALSIGLIADGRRFSFSEYYGYELWCNAGYCSHEFLENLFGPPIVRVDDEGDEHLYYLDQIFWSTPFESIESLGIGTLDTPHADQFMIGTEHRLWKNGTLEFYYLNKKTRGLIEDTCRMNTWFWGDGEPPVFDDPSTHNHIDECDGYVLANASELKRDYEAAVVKIESRGRRLQLFANYTLSYSKGSTEATADWAFSTFEYDLFPRDFMNLYGYLSDDRRHRVKVYGYVLLPWNFNIGFDARWASAPALDFTLACGSIFGAPGGRLADLGITTEYWEQVCAGALYGDVLFEPRGSRRGEPNYQLDLQIAKGFSLGATDLQLFLTVLNVLSSEQPVEYETGALEVLPWGTPLEYQLPRRWEIGVRFEF
jgi:hypothetical protein